MRELEPRTSDCKYNKLRQARTDCRFSRRTWIAFLPLQFQGFGGLSFVLSYTTYFFQVGLVEHTCRSYVSDLYELDYQLAGLANPFLGNVIVKVMQLTAQIVSFFTIEKIGRRRLLVGGGSIMTLACLVIGILGSVSIKQVPGGEYIV